MTIAQAVQHFHAKRAGKGKYTAKCPSHDDRSRNTLSIKEGNRGVLIHCWAGCPKEAVLAAAGLKFRDLFYHSRDTDSATLKAILKQQRIDALYRRELRLQDLKLWLRALECKQKPVRTKTRFEWDIEAAYR